MIAKIEDPQLINHQTSNQPVKQIMQKRAKNKLIE
jgi:hypothetical protein